METSTGVKYQRTDTCKNCKRPFKEHKGVNYSDGPLISGSVWICPTSEFLPTWEVVKENDD